MRPVKIGGIYEVTGTVTAHRTDRRDGKTPETLLKRCDVGEVGFAVWLTKWKADQKAAKKAAAKAEREAAKAAMTPEQKEAKKAAARAKREAAKVKKLAAGEPAVLEGAL